MKLFLLIFSAGIAGSVFAQSQSVEIPEPVLAEVRRRMDSLENYKSANPVAPLLAICRIERHRDYAMGNSKYYFSEDAIQAAGKQKEALIRIYALYGIATDAYNNKEYARFLNYMQESLGLARINKLYYEDLHRIRPALNNIFFHSGDYSGAMKISAEGLALSQRLNDTNRVLHFSNVIGYIHMKQKNYQLASQYYALEENLARAIKDTLAIAKALMNRADLFIEEKKYDAAIGLLQQSLEGYRTASNRLVFSLVDREASIFNRMAETEKRKGDIRAALQHVLSATRICEHQSLYLNDYDEASYFVNAGDIYNRLQLPDSAIRFLRKGLAIAELIMHKENIRDAMEQLAVSFSLQHRYDSAWVYQTAFTRLKDSISNATGQQEIMQRELSLKMQQQEIIQNAELEKHKLWRNIIAGIAVFALIIAWFLYNRYRLRQENRYQQQVNRQRNEMFNAIAVTQDEERKRIARDIHDSLGSVLSAARLKLSSIRDNGQTLSEEQQQVLRVTMQLLDEASAELRSISHNIMPATLSKLGLIAALRNLFSAISTHSGLKVEFSSHGFNTRLDEKTEMSVYRIILELVNNIVKHAGAGNAAVQLVRHPGYINLSVEDNGKGFDYTQTRQHTSGTGLANIFSRVEYLGGKMNVDAVAGRGTSVFIDIPCPGE